MNVPAKLAAFALVLALCFGGAYAVGAAVGPVDEPVPERSVTPTVDGDDGSHGEEHGG